MKTRTMRMPPDSKKMIAVLVVDHKEAGGINDNKCALCVVTTHPAVVVQDG